jgi:HAD superfamily hydrolase (TIGR01549 family)
MVVEAVVFDIGETLVDETSLWQGAAEAAGVTPFTLMGVVGGLAARGEHHSRAWEILGVEAPASTWSERDFYSDALPCLARLQRLGFRVGAVGNTPAETEAMLRPHVEFVGSSGRWGIEKPSPAFFERIVAEVGLAPERIAYVGDRVDNDIDPAIAAGLVAVHIRRGPWGHLHSPPAQAIAIRSLDELPEVIL